MMMQRARRDGVVCFVETGENRWPMVHVDDLANLYVLAVEKGPAWHFATRMSCTRDQGSRDRGGYRAGHGDPRESSALATGGRAAHAWMICRRACA
jgi:hypothetical protein